MRSKTARYILIAGAVLSILLIIAVRSIRGIIGPSPACRHPITGSVRPGTSARTLKSGGMERCYMLYIPPGYEPEQPVPAVFSLHGFASNAQIQDDITGWNHVADAEGFVVVYMDGTSFPLRWNSDVAKSLASSDDVQFFRDVVADVSQIVNIDRRRIYVNGFSNGGGMAVRIACEQSDLVAAVGSVSGTITSIPDDCATSRPVPLIAFHGTADPVVQYNGGTPSLPPGLRLLLGTPLESDAGYDTVAAEMWVEELARRSGCNMTPESIPAAGDASGVRYTGCQDNAVVVLYTIEGGGHTWPGEGPIPFMGHTSKDISASAAMWEFFQAFQLGDN